MSASLQSEIALLQITELFFAVKDTFENDVLPIDATN